MKKLIKRLAPQAARRETFQRARLEFVRFRKLLENARGVMNLFDDGREKLEGEYIFDRQYVIALVDGVIEKAGRMVFDASVLAPQAGERLFQLYDRLKNYAGENLLSPNAFQPGDSFVSEGGALNSEPEYRLLSRALAWFAGPLAVEQPVIMDLLRETCSLVIESRLKNLEAFEAADVLELKLSGIPNRFEVIELDRPPDAKAKGVLSLQDLQCRPLGMMLIGADAEKEMDGTPLRPASNIWRVIMDGDNMSLSSTDAGRQILVESTLSGHVDADFIFISAGAPLDLAGLLTPGFRLERSFEGAFAWQYDVPEKNIKESLNAVGNELFRR